MFIGTVDKNRPPEVFVHGNICVKRNLINFVSVIKILLGVHVGSNLNIEQSY